MSAITIPLKWPAILKSSVETKFVLSSRTYLLV